MFPVGTAPGGSMTPKCVATIVVPAIVGVVEPAMFLTVCEKTSDDEVIVSA